MKYILTTIFLLIFNLNFACSCTPLKLSERFERSDFVGVIEIITISDSTDIPNYFKIKVRTLEIFKGKEISEVYSLNISCTFFGYPGSKWLLFANLYDNRHLMTGYCSGNLNFSPVVDTIKYPKLDKKLEKQLKTKLQVLQSLKSHKILKLNNSNLYITSTFDELKGFSEEKSFGIYEIKLGKDLSIKKVKAIERFENKKLSRNITEYLQTQKFIYIDKTKPPIKENIKIIMILFYYPKVDGYESFISTIDL